MRHFIKNNNRTGGRLQGTERFRFTADNGISEEGENYRRRATGFQRFVGFKQHLKTILQLRR